LFLSVFLAGCALFVPHYPYSVDYPDPQPLEVIESPVRLHQRLTIAFGSREVSFRTVFDLDSKTTSLILLNPMGSRMVSVEQRRDGLSVNNALPLIYI
jgi:outer membrane biogenesis lipoprotein LolB